MSSVRSTSQVRENFTQNVIRAIRDKMESGDVSSPNELRKAAGLDASAPNRLLRKGQLPRLDTAVKLADAMGVSLDALLRPARGRKTSPDTIFQGKEAA